MATEPVHPKIAVIGNLGNYGYLMAHFLRRRGFEAELVLLPYESFNPLFEKESLPWVKPLDFKGMASPLKRPLFWLKLVKALQGYDLIFSFTGTTVYAQAAGRPYLAFANGSDIREQAQERGLRGFLTRRGYKKASFVNLLNIDMDGCARRIGLTNAYFHPFAIDTDYFSPGPENSKREGLLVFHPAHLDFTARGGPRLGTKGNDKLIRAFARLVKDDQPGARLLLLRRGPDAQVVQKLVDGLSLEKNVVFKETMPQNELIKHYRMADVVADQFDLGAYGTITLEAMSCGKPVLVYVNETYARACYKETPPVFNCRTEEEIYLELKNCLTRDLKRAGEEARDWVIKNHRWEVSIRIIEAHIAEIFGQR